MAAARIAVLGAGGFLGSHLVPRLLELGDVQVYAIDQDLHKLECRDPRVKRRVARLEQPGLIEEVTAQSSVILSLTALCTPALYNTDPLAVIDANYTELLPLVRASARHGARLIHFSTCEVYGRRSLDLTGLPRETMNEEANALFLGPVHNERWTYACAKQLLERVIYAHGAHGNLNYTIVRPFNVIGPRMDYMPGVDGDGVPRVLACFMAALLRGEDLQLVDGGQQRRSFIAVDEFCAGVLRIVERGEACREEIINLGNPQNDVTIRELARALADEYAGYTGQPRARLRDVSAAEFYGAGYDDTPVRVPDISKARRLLGFEPCTSLAEMLPGIVRDYVRRYGQTSSYDQTSSYGENTIRPANPAKFALKAV
ncbi:MAG TPA: NAD-dependent epimerase/dehydratase family protein [Polyangiaceae bacterium]|nr:NAD-dependent epimerase/dehydratase family protein [Polyangiaceae bacterium]